MSLENEEPMKDREPRAWHLVRQCNGTNRAGERCRRNAIPGGSVCILHGGLTPSVQAAAKLRLLALVEPILNTFEEIVETWHATRCETCGRPTGDPAPIIRIGQLVLDRAGFHPTLTVQQVAAPNEYANCTLDDLIEKLEAMLRDARAKRDAERALTIDALPLADVIDGYEVPDDPDPIVDERIPTGIDTLEKRTDVSD